MTTTQHGAKLTLAEYLALDIEGLWEPAGAEYTERAMLGSNDVLTTPMLPGFELPLEQLFASPDRVPASTDR